MNRALAQKIEEICKRYGISALYVFGSRAGEIAARVRRPGEDSRFPHSDVDIGVQPLFGTHLTAKRKIDLTIELEDLLSAPRLDLIVLSEAGPFLQLEVIRGESLYCDDPDRQAEDELLVLRRVGDLAHYEREKIRQILSGRVA